MVYSGGRQPLGRNHRFSDPSHLARGCPRSEIPPLDGLSISENEDIKRNVIKCIIQTTYILLTACKYISEIIHEVILQTKIVYIKTPDCGRLNSLNPGWSGGGVKKFIFGVLIETYILKAATPLSEVNIYFW